MSTTTPNLGLVKPELTDAADITAMNKNWDTIDAKLKASLQGNLEKALPVNKGGTGATSQADARNNLGAMGSSDVERVKTLTADSNNGDYVSFVIPLIAIDDDTDNNYATGDFFFKRVNTAGARMTRISISCGKKYGETVPYYALSFDEVPHGNGINIYPRTFTYNAEKWFGLYIEVLSATFNGSRYFVGRANRFDDIKMVSVYNSHTKTVLNEEIYNSLADEGTSLPRVFTGTPKVMIDGTNYEIYHEGNKPNADDVGAANADTHNIKTYSTLEQLGLTTGEETIESIVNAMPNHSRLFLNVASANNSAIYPMNEGSLEVNKSSLARVVFDFTAGSGGTNTKNKWYASYRSTVSTPWSGWIEFYDKSNPPTASDVGAAKAIHTHSASDIGEGTFASTNVKAMNGTDYSTARIRNIKASTASLTAGSSSLPNGDIHLTYE